MSSHFSQLDQGQSQGQHDPSTSDPLGSGSQLLVQVATAILIHIRIAVTGDNAQAGLLAGLEQNNQNQGNASQYLKHNQNRLQNFHFCNLPPLTASNA